VHHLISHLLRPYLRAYSEANLNYNGHIASLYFTPFLRGNVSAKCLRIRILFQLSFKHISITLAGFTIYHSHYYHKYFPPNWLIGFLEVYKYLMHCLSHCILIHDRNPYWWSAVISFTHGVTIIYYTYGVNSARYILHNLAMSVPVTFPLYVLPTQCIYVFRMDLRTNRDYFRIQHWLSGFV
jgi:hypothetical protein